MNFKAEANITDNSSTQNHYSYNSMEEIYKVTGVVLFSTVVVLGTVLNSLVIATILRWSPRRPSNYFIMNIAIADLAMSAIAAPLRIAQFYRGWPLGKVLCYVVAPMQDVFVTTSAITHTAMALESYRLIVKPLKPKMQSRDVIIICGLIWLVCYLTGSLPLAIFLSFQKVNGIGICDVIWPSDLYRRVFQVYLVVVFIIAPAIIQTAAYHAMLKSLRMSVVPCASVAVNRQRIQKKMVRTLLLMVAIFQLCYIPRGVMMLVVEFGDVSATDTTAMYAYLIILVMYYVKNVTNPIVLFTSSSDFRSNFMRFFRRE